MMGLSRTWGVLGCQCMPRPVLRGPESRWRHWPATAGAEGMRGRPEPGRRNPFTSSAQSNCLIPDSRQVTGRFSGLSVGGELPCLGTSACSLLTLTPPGKVLLKGRCERKKKQTKKKVAFVSCLPLSHPEATAASDVARKSLEGWEAPQ